MKFGTNLKLRNFGSLKVKRVEVGNVAAAIEEAVQQLFAGSPCRLDIIASEVVLDTFNDESEQFPLGFPIAFQCELVVGAPATSRDKEVCAAHASKMIWVGGGLAMLEDNIKGDAGRLVRRCAEELAEQLKCDAKRKGHLDSVQEVAA